MARKGTAGRTPEKQVGARESGIDKAIKKTKEALDGDNKETDYQDAKGKEEMEDAKEHSKEVSDEQPRNTQSDK